MAGRVRRAVSVLRAEGLRSTLYQVVIHILGFPAGLIFAIYDRFSTHSRTDVMIMIRGTQPESDTYALLSDLATRDEQCTLHILSSSGVDRSQLTLWEDTVVSISSPKIHTPDCFRALAKSDVVLCKDDSNLKWYRLFDRSPRRFVRLYHGPITKAYGKTCTSSRPRSLAENFSLVDTSPRYRAVNSDTERYFRASAEGRHPRRFRKWGYPRFDRLRQFVDGNDEPILPESTAKILESEDEFTNILYATTHKDQAYETTFFPFEDFDADRFREWCRRNEVRVFLRPHPWLDPPHDHLIDGETIFYAGQEFANSATELMPYMDGMITDYSSIYLEYLPFDKPIIFVKDQHNRFMQMRGMAFDYDQYFPGAKPETTNDFLTYLAYVVEGNDDYAQERAFVRQTFVPEKERTFLDVVTSSTGSY